MGYTYSKVTASNGVVLHTMKGSPVDLKLHSKAKLLQIKDILDDGWLYGINGGFFDKPSETIVSISLKDGKSIAANGHANAKYARGTLIWDNKAKKFYCKQLQTQAQVEALVSDKANYWAQGGISLALGKSESDWLKMIGPNGETIPGYGSAERAGLVYNNTNNVWLIITDKACTIEAFRRAIIEKVGSGTLVDGISLDGSTCAQMICKEATVTHGRQVMSVLGFKR